MKLSMNLKRHANGTWYLWIGRSEKCPRGQLVSLKTKDKEEAQRIYDEIKRKHLEDRLIRLTGESRVTLSQLADAFISDPDRANHSPDTLNLDKLSIKQLIDAVGDKLIRSVKDADLKTLKTTCLARGLQPSTINTYCRNILAALHWAVEQDWIPKAPRSRPLKTGKPLPRVLSLDEIARIKAYAKTHDEALYRVICFCLWTGLRRSEVAALRFQDCQGGYIRVVGKGNKERSIPLLPGALEAVGPLQDIGPVFPKWDVDTYSHRFHAVALGAGVRARLHDLRHTAATFMLSSGVSLPVVQKILGHSDIRTTQIYAQVVDELVRSEMQKLRYDR